MPIAAQFRPLLLTILAVLACAVSNCAQSATVREIHPTYHSATPAGQSIAAAARRPANQPLGQIGHYQIWFFSYPTGYPYPYSAAQLRKQMDAIKARYPDHKKLVVIGQHRWHRSLLEQPSGWGGESEIVIPSGHWTNQHPQGIAEVKRILHQHLGR